MKLPNDLIKATDYSKAKNREIHEFEYRNGKYIHKYVLGGEHELTPQEIIDCLNAISTIDCDLQTAYAFIQGQKDKINSLENNIIDDETLNMLVKEHKLYKDLETKLAEKEKELKAKETLNQIFKDNRKAEISFAVEQLEKVKNRIESKVESVYKRLDDLNIKIVCESTSRQLSTYEEIVKEIDNQIKQLKEGE